MLFAFVVYCIDSVRAGRVANKRQYFFLDISNTLKILFEIIQVDVV